MIQNYFSGQIPEPSEKSEHDQQLEEAFAQCQTRAIAHYEELAINKALEEIWVYINTVNRYLADNEPWKLAKLESRRGRLARILIQAAAAIRTLAVLLYPVMPESADKIWHLLGYADSPSHILLPGLSFGDLGPEQVFLPPDPLFPRITLTDFLKEAPPTAPAPKSKEKTMEQITFDEFNRMDLRVGEIMEAERVEGTNKLIKMQLDIGNETRQMISGIADTYSPEDLVGKKCIVIVNLKPAVIRGIESQAMLLAAVMPDDSAIVPFFEKDVPTGAKVR